MVHPGSGPGGASEGDRAGPPRRPETTTGRRVSGCVIRQPRLRWPIPDLDHLRGRTVLGVRRRAKYLLIDFDSGKVLATKNAEQQLEPASLTKIMTAYIVFRELRDGSISLTDQVLVSEKAWKTPGSRMF